MAAAHDLIRGRTWLSCEPVSFFSILHNGPDPDGILRGFSKPNFFPHPDDASSAQAEGLPDGTLRDVLDILCELSARFDIDWEISHDYSHGPVGYIRGGVCDEDVREQCEAFAELPDVLSNEFGDEESNDDEDGDDDGGNILKFPGI